MSEETIDLRQMALTNCFRGEDGELTPSGRIFLSWLRDTVCEWGDDPIAEDVYDGDLIKHGARLGRQQVYGRVMQELKLAPELERLVAMEEAVQRKREELDQITRAETLDDDVA